MADLIPASLAHLLDEANYGFLGTIRPDDTVQVNPMWFARDGNTIRFTHTTTRAKYRNLMRNPAMSLAVLDVTNPLAYLELRGALVEVIPDPEGEFYVFLAGRYGKPAQQPPSDKVDRVILVMSIESTSAQ